MIAPQFCIPGMESFGEPEVKPKKKNAAPKRTEIRAPGAADVCGVCGGASAHFRACADCSYVAARCAECGGRKGASRKMVLHRTREHGSGLQLVGTATARDPMLDVPRPVTRGQCQEEARPCPWVSCRHHLLLEIASHDPRVDPDGKVRDARPTTIRLNRAGVPGVLGRRRGLSADDATETVRSWIDDAVAHLETMEHTCALDVADAHADGFPLVKLAALLGVTTAAIKEETSTLRRKLVEGLAEYEDHEPVDHTSVLGRAQDR